MDIEKIRKAFKYAKSIGLRGADGIDDKELEWLIEQAETVEEYKNAIAKASHCIFCGDEGEDIIDGCVYCSDCKENAI